MPPKPSNYRFKSKLESSGSDAVKTLEETPKVCWENRLSMLCRDHLNDATKNLLQRCAGTTVPPPVDLSELIRNSESFPLKFPINTVCSSELRRLNPKAILQNNANSVHPLIHEDTLPLIAEWLEHKREQGSVVEKALYEKMGLIELVQRLLKCRAFCFLGWKDKYKILEVEEGRGGWEYIGTNEEKPPLILQNYLSYDEIKLSALLTMSSETKFVHDRSLEMKGGRVINSIDIQRGGVVIGVVGSRLQKPGFMEYQDIAIAPDQNTLENGYGSGLKVPSIVKPANGLPGLRRVWARFYGESYLPLHEEVVEHLKRRPRDPKYIRVGQKYIFDAENYIKRTMMTAEIILLEANARAMELKTTAYIHVVGFGLGTWKALSTQEIYFVKAFEIAMRRTMNKIKYVSDVMFANLKRKNNCDGLKDGDYVGHINIHFRKREPHSLLWFRQLLVVTYAGDGNALPGNEFWMGNLDESGCNTAARITQIAELHNPWINPCASAENLHIASPVHGILHIADYVKQKL